MSIKPKYIKAILSGTKKCEFRRIAFAQDVAYIVLYATKPIGKIVGYARISKVTKGSPEELWGEFAPIGGISEADFFSYFCGSSEGVAISLDSVTRIKDIELGILDGKLRPPQSFVYLGHDTFCHLVDMEFSERSVSCLC